MSLEPARLRITFPERCFVAPTWPKWLASSLTRGFRFAPSESCSAPQASASNHSRKMTRCLREPCARFSEERPFHSAIVAASHWELATKPPSSLQIEHGPIFHFPLQYDSFAEGHEVRERPVRPRARPYGEWVSPGGDGPD